MCIVQGDPGAGRQPLENVIGSARKWAQESLLTDSRDLRSEAPQDYENYSHMCCVWNSVCVYMNYICGKMIEQKQAVIVTNLQE